MDEQPFQLESPFVPSGDQPGAIDALVEGVARGDKHQVLLGATGTGKTFTVANVIQRLQRPTLVLAPNKTLAAQLYGEFANLFPNNAVTYFVSYYDYYQPEAYVPSTDTFIEKDALVNEAIDRMRHRATRMVLERRDILVVASVSCIYGIGDKGTYAGMVLHLKQGDRIQRDKLLRALIDIQYRRNDYDFHRGCFRVRGDVIEIFPTYEEDEAIRLELWGDELESIHTIDPLRGRSLGRMGAVAIFPGSHYVTPKDRLREAIVGIQDELQAHLPVLRAEGKLLEAERLGQRTLYDVEMLEQLGFCHGIENYSRHLTGRKPGEPPPVLLDYFPDDLLVVVDESHVALPQLRGMFRGDQSRKSTLVEHGFRLPSALDNRPLTYDEFIEKVPQVISLSATPGDLELDLAQGVVVEQLIRPTGLVDPRVEIRPAGDQVDDLLGEIRDRVARGDRVLVTTLTKRMAEDLTEYYQELGLQVRYLHSDIDTLERVQLLSDLRQGVFDVLIGINLLREGLDLPEVGLVAILDADKEGFLRSTRSLIQTIGRAARHLDGQVILYADRMTDSIDRAVQETQRRRDLQEAYNEEHGVIPRAATRAMGAMPSEEGDGAQAADGDRSLVDRIPEMSPQELAATLEDLRTQMKEAAERMAYEEAAVLRDRIRAYEGVFLGIDGTSS